MDKWVEIGKTLKDQRLLNGISSEVMARSLRISESLLIRIEEGALEEIAEVYARDTLKRCCLYLEIDPQALLDLYHQGHLEWKASHPVMIRRGWKPVVWWNVLVLPVLVGCLVFLGYRANAMLQDQQPRLTNLGAYSIQYRQGEEDWQELGIGQSIVFEIGSAITILNPEKNRVLVEYRQEKWSVELEGFVVEWNDG